MWFFRVYELYFLFFKWKQQSLWYRFLEKKWIAIAVTSSWVKAWWGFLWHFVSVKHYFWPRKKSDFRTKILYILYFSCTEFAVFLSFLISFFEGQILKFSRNTYYMFILSYVISVFFLNQIININALYKSILKWTLLWIFS